MTTCEPCARYAQGQPTSAIDGTRIKSLLLKILGDQPTAETEMLAELEKCPGCTKRLAARLIYINAQMVAASHGSVEGAMQAIEIELIDLPPDLQD